MMAEDKLLGRNISGSDPHRVHELYASWPDRAAEMLREKVEVKDKRYERVAYLALGGSATAGDIISDWFLSSGAVEVTVFRGALPRIRLENTLVIVCSTSGDTVETLRMAEEFRRKGADMVTISHDGKLKQMAEREGLTHVQIPLAKAPRYSLPYSLFASILVLRAASLLAGMDSEVDDAVSTMKRLSSSIGIDSPLAENRSKQIAQEIGQKVPCIYASSVTKSIARRFKNSLNENAKIHGSFDSAPDIFHNEVEAWEGRDSHQLPVILRRNKDPKTESDALAAFEALLTSRNVDPSRVEATGASNLSQLLSLCYTLDFASYYLAILNGVEPFEIALIDQLKKTM